MENRKLSHTVRLIRLLDIEDGKGSITSIG
jgi:hypothetical protein